MPAIAAEHLTKIFGRRETEVVALNDVSLAIEAGELVALMGLSGSGKTTLLRALSLIDPPTRGCVNIAGESLCADDVALVDDRRLRREMDLLRRLGRERRAAVIVVTHDERMIEGFDRVYHMTDGRITDHQ